MKAQVNPQTRFSTFQFQTTKQIQTNKPTKQRRKARKSDLKDLARAFNAKRII